MGGRVRPLPKFSQLKPSPKLHHQTHQTACEGESCRVAGGFFGGETAGVHRFLLSGEVAWL